jgi:hypothetical protein
MAQRIRFIHGRRYRFHCNKCGAKRTGIYFREGYDARAKLSCGHHRNLGYTLPPEELEAEGLMIGEESEDTLEVADEPEEWVAQRALAERNKKLITRKSIYY